MTTTMDQFLHVEKITPLVFWPGWFQTLLSKTPSILLLSFLNALAPLGVSLAHLRVYRWICCERNGPWTSMQLLTEGEFAQLQPSPQILGDVVSVVFAHWWVSLVSCKPGSPCEIFLTCVISLLQWKYSRLQPTEDQVVSLRQKLAETLGQARRFRLLAGCCVLSGGMTLEEGTGLWRWCPILQFFQLKWNYEEDKMLLAWIKLLVCLCLICLDLWMQEASLCDGCSLQLVWLPEDVFATASTDTTAAFWSMGTGDAVFVNQKWQWSTEHFKV